MTYSLNPNPKSLILALMTILLVGLTSTSAAASEPTVCIQRQTAEECRRKVELFDELAAEAVKVRTQRDESEGARAELRFLYFEALSESTDWKLKAKAAQAAADAAPSRLVWFGAGAAAGVGATVIVFILAR